jgi:hypothetical protein
MRLVLTTATFFLTLSPTFSQEAKSTKPAKDTKDGADKMIATGTVTGKLLNWGDGKKKKDTITLEVTIDIANPSGIQTQAKLENQLAQINANVKLNATDRIRQIADVNRQMTDNQKNLVKGEKHKIDFTLGDDFAVRRAELPVKTEDGKIKKYTEKEKKELKGSNPKLPGYTANEEELKNDLLVTVYLSKKKEPKGSKKDPPPPPTVTMIVIQKELTK